MELQRGCETLTDPCIVTVIHPERRNLTVIRGYSRLGGHPDDPQSDPQDRAWFGPHDRLFRQEESEQIDFKLPPPYGELLDMKYMQAVC